MMYEYYANRIIVVENINEEITNQYNITFNFLLLNKDSDMRNETGYASSYFHEVGHMIDDFLNPFGMTSNETKYDLIGALKTDFENLVAKYMQSGKDREQAYEDIAMWLDGDDRNFKSGVADIISGLSDYKIQPHFGHSEEYYTDENIEREAFANFFDAGMSYKPNKLLYIMEVFPTAYALFEKILIEKIDSIDSLNKKYM